MGQAAADTGISASGVPGTGAPAKEIDPQLELMLVEAAKDAARLRKQMAQVTVASGAVLAFVGAGLAIASLVNLVGSTKAAQGGGDPGLTAGFTATALLFALVLFGVGLWFVVKGLGDRG